MLLMLPETFLKIFGESGRTTAVLACVFVCVLGGGGQTSVVGPFQLLLAAAASCRYHGTNAKFNVIRVTF